jgi:Fe2+ or Zn2+ uptake regulation protein
MAKQIWSEQRENILNLMQDLNCPFSPQELHAWVYNEGTITKEKEEEINSWCSSK